ncbi:hypothetical protein BO94DRAFT_580908 [Aspergillus sclerotioniger CBS 115572]|uniref:Uncharacterized protein n=1 Tax=Aspergillus sclerotioniger CBS 115572 TaxID=1450535 RepID=A0A317XDF6_9EURO|nr:hypothetical protein BO94DRAFT_580908 [Aspergillus sclerotioniger CBS 115572]PWY95752.1 hypothetical protein BO94DRAFT_580908 [Aspergillus sclerotioniger CBS 115572]
MSSKRVSEARGQRGVQGAWNHQAQSALFLPAPAGSEFTRPGRIPGQATHTGDPHSKRSQAQSGWPNSAAIDALATNVAGALFVGWRRVEVSRDS